MFSMQQPDIAEDAAEFEASSAGDGCTAESEQPMRAAENSAQHKLNQRREARRKKILENSKKRLEMLNGRTSELNGMRAAHSDTHEFSDPEVEPDFVPPGSIQQAAASSPPRLSSAFAFNSFSSGGNESFEEFLLNATAAAGGGAAADGFTTTSTSQAALVKKPFVLKTKLHIVVAVILSFLIYFMDYSETLGVFGPIGAFIIVEMLFYRAPKQLNPIVSLVITMCGLNAHKANRIWHVLSTVQSLLTDVGIFIFIYCLLTYILVSISDKFVDLIVSIN